MRDSENAAEHLRVIRQLMERATVYRAISAPTALGGGLAAIALAAWQHFQGVTWQNFLATWLSLFVLLSLVNLALLWRDARQRGQPFFSSGMKMALHALAPPLFAGGVIGIVSAWKTKLLFAAFYGTQQYMYQMEAQRLALTAAYWAVFYGLALLATRGFSPPSVAKLGWGMTLAGIIGFLGHYHSPEAKGVFTAPVIMGIAFGLFHVLYSIDAWSENRPKKS